jgi:hypothetical protein
MTEQGSERLRRVAQELSELRALGRRLRTRSLKAAMVRISGLPGLRPAAPPPQKTRVVREGTVETLR